jgi:sugar phosphate isomerase/epimerase
MLCNVSVQNVHLREAIPLAAASGFRLMSITARSHKKSGMTNDELLELLGEHGVRVQEVEAAFDWLVDLAEAGTGRFQADYDTAELLDVAAALGARTLTAIHFGPPRPPDVAAAGFARLCDRAAERGIDVALEYAAIATVADLLGDRVDRGATQRRAPRRSLAPPAQQQRRRAARVDPSRPDPVGAAQRRCPRTRGNPPRGRRAAPAPR